MRINALFLVGILIISFGCTKDQTQKIENLELENAALKARLAPPPSSLDSLYPPQTEQPEYLFRKLGMSTFLFGIVADLLEKDVQNLKTSYENFRVHYIEISKLVPEWEKAFPLSPVDELGEAIEGGDQEKVMGVFEKLGKVCHDCHVVNMAKVQQKYRWMDFSEIKVKDPLSEEELDFTRLKQSLNTNFSGILIDVEQGQGENAQKHLQDFKARFQVLKDTCEDCHGTDERKYYADENIQTLIDEMGKALSSSPIDPKAVRELAMGIGMDSCTKCHLVHVPAAYAKLRWNK
jgi:cytochrome c556